MIAIKISSLMHDIIVAIVSEFVIINFSDHALNWLEYLARFISM